MAVLRVHGGRVLRQAVPAEGLEEAQGGVQAGAEGCPAAGAPAKGVAAQCTVDWEGSGQGGAAEASGAQFCCAAYLFACHPCSKGMQQAGNIKSELHLRHSTAVCQPTALQVPDALRLAAHSGITFGCHIQVSHSSVTFTRCHIQYWCHIQVSDIFRCQQLHNTTDCGASSPNLLLVTVLGGNTVKHDWP